MSNTDRQTTTDDSASSEEYDLEEIAWEITKAFGVPIRTTQALVDQYRHYAWFALSKVEQEIAAGKQIRSPFAIMQVKLRSGEIQAEVAAGMWEEPEVDPQIERLRQKWHNTLANPTLHCAPKTLARRGGDKTVRCICGCGESFPAEVSGG